MPEPRSIWIDLDNSPHVPLFIPIIRHCECEGVEVLLTARDHSQTIELLKLVGLDGRFTKIGRHYGKSKLAKIRGVLTRAYELASFIGTSKARPAVAVSHGSRAMVLAAKLLGISVVTMYDYEFTETKIFNRLSNVVIVPDAIPNATLDEIGLPEKKRRKYAGIKEELYVRYFEPNATLRRQFANDERVLAVLRPPATTANYHSEKSEGLLDDVLHLLTAVSDVLTVIVSRTKEQREEIQRILANIPNATERTVLLKESVDGLQLAYAADLLISGGGTMNREAALLGVPVYSIFAGRQGALDRQMEADGRIVFIRDASDLSKIKLERRERAAVTPLTDRVERFVIEQIDAFL